MIKRINWDISIDNSKQILGGYLETRLMTKTEIKRYCINLGKEFLHNNPHIDKITYSCWEEDDDEIKNVSDLEYICITLYRDGKKIKNFSY